MKPNPALSSVGDFNVGIYATETGTDRDIIIRNRLVVEGYIFDNKKLFHKFHSHKVEYLCECSELFIPKLPRKQIEIMPNH